METPKEPSRAIPAPLSTILAPLVKSEGVIYVRSRLDDGPRYIKMTPSKKDWVE